MKHNGQAELRIFTGIHAGARVMLATGSHVLGADPCCDLIISDTGVADRHAELRISESNWLLYPLQACEGISVDGMQLAPGRGVSLGPVLIAVDAANSPWIASIPVLPVDVLDETEQHAEPLDAFVLPEPDHQASVQAVEEPGAKRKINSQAVLMGMAVIVALLVLWLMLILNH